MPVVDTIIQYILLKLLNLEILYQNHYYHIFINISVAQPWPAWVWHSVRIDSRQEQMAYEYELVNYHKSANIAWPLYIHEDYSYLGLTRFGNTKMHHAFIQYQWCFPLKILIFTCPRTLTIWDSEISRLWSFTKQAHIVDILSLFCFEWKKRNTITKRNMSLFLVIVFEIVWSSSSEYVVFIWLFVGHCF